MQDYIEKEKEVQIILLEFIDGDIDHQTFFSKLGKFQLPNNYYEFKTFLYILLNISNNHFRLPTLFTKIEQIILFFKTNILQLFSNFEIFHIFLSNNRILLFLIEEEILKIDESIFKKMNNKNFRIYFLPELHQFSDQNNSEEIDQSTFFKNRKNGENESFLCEMIRNDSVVDFITYVNQANLQLSSQINSSIFETNQFLIDKNPTLIEYSAFFGSNQIFRYLFNSGVRLYSKLWLYAIHGRNPEIIHFLEEYEIRPDIKAIKESMKCFHNEITEYFLDNYSDTLPIDDNLFSSNVKCYNFQYFPQSFFSNQKTFYYLCKSDNYFLVETLLKERPNIDININVNNLNKNTMRKHISTPINAAATKMNWEIFDLLLSQENIKICDNCFRNCDTLTKISIPSFITSISRYAFKNCVSLVEISIPSSVKHIGYCAFQGCKSLEKISIPYHITEIDDFTFYDCSSLTQISIPPHVTRIGQFAFYGCSSLTQISLPYSLNKIDLSAFSKCTRLEKILFINKTANKLSLCGCDSLPRVLSKEMDLEFPHFLIETNEKCGPFDLNTKLTCKLNLDSIKLTFCGTSMLPKVSIPPQKKSFNNNFCFFQTSLIYPSFSKVIFNMDAFYCCSVLKEITIPSSVDSICNEAFKNCSLLEKVVFEKDSSLSNIGEYAFHRCTSLKEISLPPLISSIKRGCFAGCSKLTKISIPDNVNEIDCFAFNGCTSLADIKLPLNLFRINKCAFKNCQSLKEIVIPENVRIIENYAFYGCKSLSQAIVFSSNNKSSKILSKKIDCLLILFRCYYPKMTINNYINNFHFPPNILVIQITKKPSETLFYLDE